ncbi:hypothetical protein WICPIJ_001585 [Wickerhamomyces pijperi]|uniref:Inosine/uridine-preferring nucleoside hydrolase domain-containing protein n=1 Tax=Wickerhamomyces pijperi TaxID=599730 RepID=A0A9P8QDC6_WICPI|nr:hypothetical protein WICPIJ_001585 [Wickerhamomyces pijperi]
MLFNKATLFSLCASIASAKKIFIDNDGLTALQVLFPLAAGHEIVGISGSFGSVSLVDAVGQGYDVLENYNLSSCIPHYAGAAFPLIRTADTFYIWEQLYGELVWQGGWDPQYEDSYTWANFTYNDTTSGAVALINAVRENKDTDPVYIYAAGMMTTVAQAISIYPNLTQEAAGLYIMGGMIDFNYAQATTDKSINVDIQTDINLIQDPEAAQIVLAADWKESIVGGNVTNYVLPSQDLYDEIIERAGSYETIENTDYLSPVLSLISTGNFTENNEQETLPFWDEVVSAYMSYPEILEQSFDAACAVDTSFNSPYYGNLRLFNKKINVPKSGYKSGNCTLASVVDQEKFFDLLVDILFKDWRGYCETGAATTLVL